jgi:DNA segregation ATPase FtsK/SpoIIIE-like protein
MWWAFCMQKNNSNIRTRAITLLFVDVFFLALNVPITFLMFHIWFWFFTNKTILTFLLASTLIALGVQTYRGLTSMGTHWKLYRNSKIKIDETWSDELYGEAKGIALRDGECSTSILQPELGIGYVRAKNLMDLLMKEGVIELGRGSAPRKVIPK